MYTDLSYGSGLSPLGGLHVFFLRRLQQQHTQQMIRNTMTTPATAPIMIMMSVSGSRSETGSTAKHSGLEKESTRMKQFESTVNSWPLMLTEGLDCCQLERAQNTFSVWSTEFVSICPRNTTPLLIIVLHVGSSMVCTKSDVTVQLHSNCIIRIISSSKALAIDCLSESPQEMQSVSKIRIWKLTREFVTEQVVGGAVEVPYPLSINSHSSLVTGIFENSFSLTTHW